ncbi:MAG: nucleotide sugar dehydrogenase [Candidatus Omnitrophota bacterium]|nr:nucleotide sugar dehydrogenase [Candidatus Omnitrophota bacterium]
MSLRARRTVGRENSRLSPPYAPPTGGAQADGGMIGFAGLSHLGVVSSITAAAQGCEVVGFDPDSGRCANLQVGRLEVFEPGLPELVAANRSRLRWTADAADLRACDLIVFSPDVTTDRENRSDLSSLRRLIDGVTDQAAADTVLVVLSQVPPGFTRQLAAQRESRHLGAGNVLYYQVETLVFGRAVERSMHPERFIVGCPDPAVPLPAPYAAWLGSFGCPILRMRYESAELAKVAINMLLTASISATNTLAELCEAIGADWSDIAPVLRLDRRIGSHAYLNPGLGLAGGNLERDLVTVRTLAGEWGTDVGVVEAWVANSLYRRDWALRAIHTDVLPACPQPTIAMWGLAYKPETQSTKNSPALALIEALAPCSIQAYDPQVVLEDRAANVTQAASALEACRDADALVVMTPWPEFSTIDVAQIREQMAGRVIIDPFGALDRQRCRALGLRHLRLGSPAADGSITQ